MSERCQATSASVTVQVLTAVWESVLQRTAIGPSDNFFELGGNPTVANRLFAQITHECGREVSPLTIYQAPTIASLADLLEDPAMPRLRPIVPLNDIDRRPPVFMVHGMGGSVMEFFQLVKNLHPRSTIYGMQRRGMDGAEKPLERIEDLAQYYVDKIQSLQPRGPYLLVGYSLGGLITLEIAQLLLAKGENVSLLVMIETYPHWNYLSIWQNCCIAKRILRPSMGKLFRALGIRTKFAEEPAKIGDHLEVGKLFAPVLERVSRGDHLMWQRYRPRYYKGKVNFIRRTEGSAKFPIHPLAVWGRLVDELVIDTVPGDHLGVLATHSKSIAALLSRYLEQVPTSE